MGKVQWPLIDVAAEEDIPKSDCIVCKFIFV